MTSLAASLTLCCKYCPKYWSPQRDPEIQWERDEGSFTPTSRYFIDNEWIKGQIDEKANTDETFQTSHLQRPRVS